ncbi:MAG: nitroreductase family protein [Candidatus Tectomicrobia bacterium]|uniref:Nitroreductase family protein n=1 Tax=Tectimicrobiota bacterium TaxID=2528274 RepID=A0A932GSA7_UNCTE|nr:nitroreductase family protein [Candidatus Tectomicrobia bacterium]
MEAYLAIVSKREVRDYLPDPIREEEMNQILEAGRASGSSRNRQHWRFILMRDRKRLRELSVLVTRPANLTGCAAAIVVVLTNPRAQFDAGRAAQNMMLAAWSLGIGSCPNTPADEPGLKTALRVPGEAGIPTIISLGYPAPGAPRPRPRAKPEEVLARIDRLPLKDLVYREVYGG